MVGVERVSGGDAAWMGCGDEGGGDDRGEDNDGEDEEGEDGKGEGDTERKASGSTTLPRPLLIFVRRAVQCAWFRMRRLSGKMSARRNAGK